MELTPFDALPIPRYLRPSERNRQFTYYEVTMRHFFHQMHSEINNQSVGL